jgi:hypothetical protein
MRLTPEELAARNRRNRAIAAGLVVFIVLVFGVTILKLANNADDAGAGAGAAGQVSDPAR